MLDEHGRDYACRRDDGQERRPAASTAARAEAHDVIHEPHHQQRADVCHQTIRRLCSADQSHIGARAPDASSFDEALGATAATLTAPGGSPVTDRRITPTNVLVYYGVGGIGKTTLSEEPERDAPRYLDRAR
jgi:hypothetical protein